MMKKKLILGAAICAMTFGGLTAFAQDAATGATACATACTQNDQCHGRPDCADKPCPFEGLNLTDAQKEQLKQLRQQQSQQAQNDKKKKRDARVAARREYLAKVKAILTPEQYVTYLENLAVQAPGRHFKGQPGHQQGQRRGAGHHGHGQRPARQAAPAQQQ